jgi:hypothetical protein
MEHGAEDRRQKTKDKRQSCWLVAVLEKENMSGGRLVNKILVLLMAIMSMTVFCSNEGSRAVGQTAQKQSTTAQSKSGKFVGTVLETIKAAPYTYLHVDTGTEKIWTATPAFKGKVGDMVVVPKGFMMRDFHSKTLNRDFEFIYFAEEISVMGRGQGLGRQAQMPAGHPIVDGKRDKSQIEVSGIEKVEGGKTVAEIFAAKENLAGEKVLIRGKVVKFTPRIMGKNWLHLQDGSGSKGTNDLTVTTNEIVAVGDLVLVSGVVSIDRDFGFGYSYEPLFGMKKPYKIGLSN